MVLFAGEKLQEKKKKKGKRKHELPPYPEPRATEGRQAAFP